MNRSDIGNLEATMVQALGQGNLGAALQSSLSILQQFPEHHQAHLTAAKVRHAQGLYGQAKEHAKRARTSMPSDLETTLVLAMISASLGESKEAIELNREVLNQQPGNQQALVSLASVLERTGKKEQALKVLQQADLPKEEPASGMIRAKCHFGAGNLDQAKSALDACLANPMLDHGMSGARQRRRLLLQRALVNDALQQYDAAMQDAMDAKRPDSERFNPEQFSKDIDNIIECFDVNQYKVDSSTRPSTKRHVFIVGMPRSGTTLVEQILDAHPKATGVGEFKSIHVMSTQIQHAIGSWAPWPASAKGMSIDNRHRFANAYESELDAFGFTGGDIFVNKQLLNMRLLGLIAMLFPKAKVIYTHRSAKDVAVSCMLGNFAGQVHPELQSLEGISSLLEQHNKLRAHWDQVLPLQTLDVSYEELIEKPDGVTHEILKFCGLEWSDKCAEFYNSDRTVMTLSYDQVRRPMYATSVNRSKQYVSHLEGYVWNETKPK